MFIRGLALSLAAFAAAGLFAESAMADHRKPPRRVIIEEEYPPGPPILRAIPGVRIFFGDYALSEEEFDRLYGPRTRDDEDYYEPQPVKPKKKAASQEQAQKKDKKKQAAKKQAKPSDGKQAEAKKKAGTKTAAATPALSCEKAATVVGGYGFSGITPSSCSGKVYAFNATRDGKTFAIKLDSASGELTEVKKLP